MTTPDTEAVAGLAFDAEFVRRALVASGGVRDAVFHALDRVEKAALTKHLTAPAQASEAEPVALALLDRLLASIEAWSVKGGMPVAPIKSKHDYCWDKAAEWELRHILATPPALPAQGVAPAKPRFADVSCSRCGRGFGPGNHGFSHCEDHAHLKGHA